MGKSFKRLRRSNRARLSEHCLHVVSLYQNSRRQILAAHDPSFVSPKMKRAATWLVFIEAYDVAGCCLVCRAC
ncbi:hypothetical protein M758_UG145800 [Ceratodon purpureus]|nr:hypothetical protein M758_UG145800 [Ceratodon purpureus]